MSQPEKRSRQESASQPAAASSQPAPAGGTGKSSKKLVGWDNFVRHNPMSDRFGIIDFDHVEFYCTDATNHARRFATAFGMQMVASSDIENGNFRYTSYCMRTGSTRFVFTAPYWTEAPPGAKVHVDAFPDFNREFALNFVSKHGMAARAIGIQVDNATKAYEQCVANGGKGSVRPMKISDEHGTLTYSEVVFYEDVVFRFVEGRKDYKGNFFPGYVNHKRPEISYGIKRIDHIVSNVPCLVDVTEHLNKMIGLHEFGEFTAEDVGTVDSGLNSMVMANNDEMVLMPINEPTFGTRRKSQIQSFIEHHQGPGVQHIALQTDDILTTLAKMKNQTDFGGVEFMGNPGADYYENHVPQKMKGLVSQELIDECRKLSILIDRDEEGGLLQIFTKPLLDRPTLFVEIIQRVGCPTGDGRQKPACGGFGKGNFGALFKSIEDWEKERDGEAPVKK